MKQKDFTLSGVSTDNGLASGWATGRNGWRFEFHVFPGLIEIDMKDRTDYSAKADARQIKRELKKCFAHIYGAK